VAATAGQNSSDCDLKSTTMTLPNDQEWNFISADTTRLRSSRFNLFISEGYTDSIRTRNLPHTIGVRLGIEFESNHCLEILHHHHKNASEAYGNARIKDVTSSMMIMSGQEGNEFEVER
jgi:hypothetical protein